MTTKMNILAIMTGLLVATPLTSIAEDAEPPQDKQDKLVVGATTETVLTLQREGKAAGSSHPVAGDAATRSYKRYMDSFDKPMPDFTSTGAYPKSSSGR